MVFNRLTDFYSGLLYEHRYFLTTVFAISLVCSLILVSPHANAGKLSAARDAGLERGAKAEVTSKAVLSGRYLRYSAQTQVLSPFDLPPEVPVKFVRLARTPVQPVSKPEKSDPEIMDGIDYRDFVGRGAVPLEQVGGKRNEWISKSFRVRDFASRDGASYARISDKLVQSLEQLRSRTGSLAIISGYRHPAYNARVEIGGVKDSQHIAGRAADIWSGTKTPLELADLAIETLGCNIGLGLGPNTLHIDLRGRLRSWTYAGAALSEQDFDRRVQQACGIAPMEEEIDVEEGKVDSTLNTTRAAPIVVENDQEDADTLQQRSLEAPVGRPVSVKTVAIKTGKGTAYVPETDTLSGPLEIPVRDLKM